MKMKTRYFSIIAVSLFVSLFSSAQTQPMQTRLLYDNDGSELLFNTYWNCQPLTLPTLDSLVDIQRHTPVTTYAVCSGSDFFYYRSRFGRLFGDDLNGRIARGSNDALYQLLHGACLNFERLEAAGTDLLRATLSRARQNGMEAMITMRMNDLHFTDTTLQCPVAYSDWWLRHPQYWTHDDTQGWHTAGAYDFAHKEVRQRKLNIIREQLAKYGDILDIYLLDYMRFFCYFKSGEGKNHTTEMTQWMRQIRQAVDKESRRRHHKILLAARVAPTLKDNLRNGLDLREWLREGLLDFVSIGEHTRIDPNMPIRELKQELGPLLNIPLYVSNDCVAYTENEPVTEGMMRGFCSAALSKGADGIYLFNYFFNDYNRGRYHLEEGGQTCRVAHPRMLQELGSLSTLEGRNKVYFLSDGRPQYGIHPNTPLPLKMQSGSSQEVTIYVGDSLSRQRPEEVILFFRTQHPAEVTVTLNGCETLAWHSDYPRLYNRDVKLQTDDHEYAVTLPVSALRHGDNILRFTASEGSKPFTIKRTELALKYGKVEEFGYF
jgi:hypothetical protein